MNLNKGVRMSFKSKRDRKKQAETLSELSCSVGEEIEIGREKSTVLPVLHMTLGTLLVGSSIVFGSEALSYGLLGIFVLSGIWILGKI